MYNSNVNLNNSTPPIVRIEKAFFQIFIAFILIFFSWASFNIIRFPYGIDYGEAPLIDQVSRIENHELVYKADLNSPPYIVSNYPPLYTLLLALIRSIFNTPLFQTGRILSLFFSVLSGIVIGLFGYRLTRMKILGVMSAVIFLGNSYVMLWSSLARVDMMALAFSLIGLFILFWRKDSPLWIIIACFCFLVSAYTRQTYLLAAPLGGFFWLYHLSHRRSILFVLIMASLTLIVFGTINAITQGGFYINIIVANINRYDLSRTVLMLRQLFILWPVILITSAIVIIIVIRNRKKAKGIFPFVTKPDAFLIHGLSFFSLGALTTSLTVGKVGSDVNYFLELMAACAIWMSVAFMLSMKTGNPKRWIIFCIFFIQLIWVFVGSTTMAIGVIGSRWEKLAYYDGLYRRINAATRQGIVLSDDYLDMVVLSGQSIYYQPFEYGQLYRAGLWDPQNLSTQIQQREFPLIVIGGDTVDKECCWPAPVVNALVENYNIESDSNVILLTPKGK